jgi:cation-transporting ATPase F
MGADAGVATGLPRVPDDAHHSLPAHEVVLLLETDVARGLRDEQVTARREQFGPNVLPAATSGGSVVRFLRQLHHPLIYVLLGAGLVTTALGERVDATVIFLVVLLNAVVGFVQESKAESALDALRTLVRTEAVVQRDGHRRVLGSEELVPGDVVLLEAGDKVPADLRVVEEVELQVDESALTGESIPVEKDEVVVPPGTEVADRRNMAHSGTFVTHGSGVGVVVATGAETELGDIHRLVGSAADLATPLTRKLGALSKALTVVILVLAAVTFGIGVARGQEPSEMLTAAVALAVGAIPEGLPAAVTITLAIGVGRMARRRAVVRRMPAVETLGSTTVVCSDKTGTLTENRQAVRRIWTVDGEVVVPAAGATSAVALGDEQGRAVELEEHRALWWTLLAGALCNDARVDRDGDEPEVVGEPTEAALLAVAGVAGMHVDEVAEQLPRCGTVPFSSERKLMATLHDQHDQHDQPVLVLVKGAVERVLERCTTQRRGDGADEPLDAALVAAAADSLASEGLRVLALAVGRSDGDAAATEQLRGLTLVGLEAMQDPPRPSVAAAVRSCHQAGIDVKMITGDHATTAKAIALQLGILDGSGEVLTGPELAALSAEDLPGAVDRAAVFARVTPEQKLRLVEGLQASGQVVAMTGDGVNDAPALQQADIGVAMGRGGTEVAKDAADVVLTDDDFATIEAAVEEGRGIFDNLTKFIVWTLPTNAAEGLVILVAVLLGVALPILPVQILWINMTTAILLGLTLAFEPKEADLMQRPPRDPRQGLLSRALLVRIGLVSAVLVAGAWWLYEWELAAGASAEGARTAALNLFVVVEAAYLFSCRSLTRSAWSVGLMGNRWLLGGVVAQAVGQMAITYLPAMHVVFQTAPIGPGAWVRIAGVALLAALVVALDKRRSGGEREAGPTGSARLGVPA